MYYEFTKSSGRLEEFWSTTTKILQQKSPYNFNNTFLMERKEVWQNKFRQTSRT